MQLPTRAFRPVTLACKIYEVAHLVGKIKSCLLFPFVFSVIKGVISLMQDAQLVKIVRRPKLRAGGLKAAKFRSRVFTPQRINSTPKAKESQDESLLPTCKFGSTGLKSAGCTQNGMTENQNLAKAGAPDRKEAGEENTA